MQSNTTRRLVPLTAAASLALAVGQASAVEIEVLDLGPFNTVRVAILGSQDFIPDDITKRGLMLGWRQPGHDGGYVQALRLRPARRDVNGDGYADAIALFRLSETDFQDLLAGHSVLVEVRGLHWDGGIARPFVAQATVVGDDDPSSACTIVQNSLEVNVGTRCIWTEADGSTYKPIDSQQLVDDLNGELTNIDLQIASTSAVVIEAYGGKGHGGGNKTGMGCTANGGSAGGPGYARTITSVGTLADLYIYPGESAGGEGGGGASTVVSTVDLASLSGDELGTTTADDLAGFGILAIAGGGAGGGHGNTSGGTECHHGGDGGPGASATAGTSSDATGAGGDGSAHGTPGDGGDGTGGDGSPDGSGGIGGPGGASYEAGISGTGGGAFWDGWSSSDNIAYNPTGWAFGAGGAGSDIAGAGGAGFGGGGAADGGGQKHKGGGGGGGSFAAQATVDAGDLDSSLIYGTPDQTDATSQVVVTFELVAGSE